MVILDWFVETYRAGLARKRLERQMLEKQLEVFETLWNNIPGQSSSWLDVSQLYSKNEQGELVVNFSPELLARLRSEARYLSFFNPHAKSIWRKFLTYVLGKNGIVHVAEPRDPNNAAAKKLADEINKAWEDFEEAELWWDRQNEIARRIVVDGEAFIEVFMRPNKTATVRFIDPERVVQDARGLYPFGVVTDPNDAETRLGFIVNGTYKDARNVVHLRTNNFRNMPRGITEFTAIIALMRQYDNLQEARLKLNILRATHVMIRKFKGMGDDKIKDFLSKIKSGTTSGGSPTESKYPGAILNSSDNIEYEFHAPNVGGEDAQHDRKSFMQSIAAGSGLAYYAISGDSNDNKYAGALTAESPMLKELVWWQTKFVWDFTEVQRRILLAMGYTPEQLALVILNGYPADIESKDILVQAQADEIDYNMGAESLTGICKRRGRDYEQVRAEREIEEAGMPAGDEQ